METCEIILEIIEIFVLVASIIVSAFFILKKINKSKNLETIKYLSTIRKEIWELMDYKKMETFIKDEEKETNGKGKIRSLKQKLEYMAAAINNDVLTVKLVKDFCGRWFQSAVRILKINDFKNEKSEKESYDEIKKLYETLDKLYNK